MITSQSDNNLIHSDLKAILQKLVNSKMTLYEALTFLWKTGLV